jgi:Kdo2-lipid IVA lauroyltransferase/acyltransferase
MEMCRLLARPLEETLDGIVVDGLDHVRRVMEANARIIVISAHLGAWELLPLLGRFAGHPVTVVERPVESDWLRPLVTAIRAKTGAEVLDKRGALPGVAAALRRGDMVGVLIDQNASRREGVFVPFFGRPASATRSIGLLALRTDTVVVPAFIRRTGFARHRVTVHPPIARPQADAADPVAELTARCAAAIEAAIRDVPEQWLWIHRRWRTQPARPASR